MSQPSEKNLALFIDFDNVAIGARDSRQRFDVKLLLQRVLEKGKVVVKRAYADWHYYKEHMTALHEAAIDLIEVPAPKISGKNSADIRLVVDAIDLCYAKSHIDTFVIVSGDSDFSPLVSKLRENDKRVIGIGMRSSSSHLLIANCDEFIFYDDIYNSAVSKLTEKVSSVPQDLRELFDFLLQTTKSLLQESRGVLYASLLKDTMKRKQPEFNESNYGYTTFGELLEDARDRGLLEVERDSRAGGTLVVLGLGKNEPKEPNEANEANEASVMESSANTPADKSSRSSRRSSRRRSRKKTKVLEPAKDASTRPTSPADCKEPAEAVAGVVESSESGVAAGDDPRSSAKTTGKTTRKRSATSNETAKTAQTGKADKSARSAKATKTAKKSTKRTTGKPPSRTEKISKSD